MAKVVKDALWLRKKDDGTHINVAELDAGIKGVNLALKWWSKKATLATDSATVHSWLHASDWQPSGESRVQRRCWCGAG